MPLPLPVPTDPVSLGIALVTNFLGGLFGKPSQSEILEAQRAMCRAPATWRPDVCGPAVWGAINCGPGGEAKAFNQYGAPVACRCQISAIWDRSSGCSIGNVVKDNFLLIAGAAAVIVISLR